MRKNRCFLTILALLSGWSLWPLNSLASDASTLARQAAETYKQEVQGIVSCQVTSESRIRSAVFNRLIQTDADVVLKDGLPFKTVLARMLVDGKPVSKEQLEQQEKQVNDSASHNFFKAPYDAHYLGDYAYELSPEAKKGLKAIHFSSNYQDAQHGDGTMWLDAHHRVVEVRYTQNKLPQNTDHGSIHLDRGEVGGFFATRLMQGEYGGAKGFIRGTFTIEQRFSHYRRCKSVEEALGK